MFNLRTKWHQLPACEKRLTLATKFTLLRLACVPVIAYTLYHNWLGITLGLILLAALSDLIDGYLARNFQQATILGAILDPLADKLLMLTIFVSLIWVPTPVLQLPTWFVGLVLFKELVQIIGAILLFNKSVTLEIKARVFGKLAMAAQVALVLTLFISYYGDYDVSWLKTRGLATMTVLILLALGDYTYRGYRQCSGA